MNRVSHETKRLFNLNVITQREKCETRKTKTTNQIFFSFVFLMMGFTPIMVNAQNQDTKKITKESIKELSVPTQTSVPVRNDELDKKLVSSISKDTCEHPISVTNHIAVANNSVQKELNVIAFAYNEISKTENENRQAISELQQALLKEVSNQKLFMEDSMPIIKFKDTFNTVVEVKSSYPGGQEAWQRFLSRRLVYPAEALHNDIEGEVLVEFTVDQKGKVSNIKAISGPKVLRRSAEHVIKRSGRWTPAMKNGQYITSVRKQLISFQLKP